MDLTVTLVSEGRTTIQEVAALQSEVEDALRQLHGVTNIAPVREITPAGAKGVGDLFGAMMVCVAPDFVAGVFHTLVAVVSRPLQPQIEVHVTTQGTTLKFDPKKVSLNEMAEFVTALRASPGDK